MHRNFLPKAVAFSILTAGLTFAGAQQPTTPPDPGTAQTAPMAPHHQHRPRDPEHEIKFLTKKLNLTPDQASKLQPILADRDQKMAALDTNTQLAPKDRHEQMRSINDDAQQQMAGILNPDQQAQLKSMHHHHGPHGPQDGGPMGPDGTPPPPPPSGQQAPQ